MTEQLPSHPEQNPQARDFRLDEVLTAVSGVNFLDTEDPREFNKRVGGLLGYATNENNLEIFQLGRVADEVTPTILRDHPEIAEIMTLLPKDIPDDAPGFQQRAHERAVRQWYDDTKKAYGDKMGEPVAISPISPEDHTHIDAGAEFQLMGGTTIDSFEGVADLFDDATDHPSAPAEKTLPELDATDKTPEATSEQPHVVKDVGDTAVRSEVAVPPVEQESAPQEIIDNDPNPNVDRAFPKPTEHEIINVGNEMERYAEAMAAMRWAEHLIDPHADDTVTPPGNPMLAYHMSKAITDGDRRAVVDAYVHNPDSLVVPPGVM